MWRHSQLARKGATSTIEPYWGISSLEAKDVANLREICYEKTFHCGPKRCNGAFVVGRLLGLVVRKWMERMELKLPIGGNLGRSVS